MVNTIYGILITLNEFIDEYANNSGQLDGRVVIYREDGPYAQVFSTFPITLGSHSISLYKKYQEVEYSESTVVTSYVLIDDEIECIINLDTPSEALETIRNLCTKYYS